MKHGKLLWLGLLLAATASHAVPNSKLLDMSKKLDKVEAADAKEKREKAEAERRRQAAQNKSCIASLEAQPWSNSNLGAAGYAYGYKCNSTFFMVNSQYRNISGAGSCDYSIRAEDRKTVESTARKVCECLCR